MRLEIEIPSKEQAILGGCPIPLAPKGTQWKESCIPKARDIGVYVIHHAGVVKCIGKTTGPNMSFGMRLRREFQETASGGKHIYPKLASLAVPPSVMASFFSDKDIEKLIHTTDVVFGRVELIEIFETVLIHAYQPEFQLHQASQEE